MAEQRVINLRGRGMRGLSFSEIARSTGAFGTLPGDSDATVSVKFADYAIQQNPNFKGEPGPTGSSDNTYTSLSTFKASPTSRNTASLVRVSGVPNGRFDWTLGNFSATPANRLDRDVIKADSTALTTGAWVRHGAVNLSYGAGSVADALDAQQSKLARIVYVTDPPYNVTSAMTPAQQSAGIMAAINANKGGTIIIPARLGLTYSGIILSGPTYNNTRIVVEDDSLFQANPNPANGNFQTTTYCMFVFHDCDGCSMAIPGSLNGNRTNQPQSQQQPLVMLAGVTNFFADDGWTVKEVRGDGWTVLKKTLNDPASKNSDTVYIGSGIGINSEDDGRNIISVISGLNVTIGNLISKRIGGVIFNASLGGPERMPGGFDCEPDPNAGHYVENLTHGNFLIVTNGTSGYAFIGANRTGTDADRDWNIVNVQGGNVTVIHTDTTGIVGGPIIRRVRGAQWGKVRLVRSSRSAGIDLDYLDFAEGTVEAVNCLTGVTLGYYDFVKNSNIRCVVDNHSGAAVLAIGIQDSKIDVVARKPQGAGSYGINIATAGRTGLTQTGVRYTIDCPNDVNLSQAIRCGGVVYGPGTAVVGGALLGYSGYAVQLTSIDNNVIPTEQVQGRNYASVVPANGTWAADDFVKKIGITAGGSPGWYNTTAGNPTFKAAAAVAA